MWLRRLVLTMLAGVLSGCAGAPAPPTPTPSPDPEVAGLVALTDQAAALAGRAAGEAVRVLQLDTDRTWIAWRFMDLDVEQEVSVRAPDWQAAPDTWTVTVTPVLKPHAGLDLRGLHVGPERVGAAALAHWPDCAAPTFTLFGMGVDLEWTVFCRVPAGTVTGTMDAAGGDFVPSAAPPIPLPPTAGPV